MSNFLMIGIDSTGFRLIHNVEVPITVRMGQIFPTACKETRDVFAVREFVPIKLVVIEGTHVHEYNQNEVAELLA